MASGCLSGFSVIFLTSIRLGSSPTPVEPSFFLSVWLPGRVITVSGLPRRTFVAYHSVPLGSCRHSGAILGFWRRFRAALDRLGHGRPLQAINARPPEVILRGGAKTLGYLLGPAAPGRPALSLGDPGLPPRSKPQYPKHQSLRAFQTAVCILGAYEGPSPAPLSVTQRA